jgi:hypothetical protein
MSADPLQQNCLYISARTGLVRPVREALRCSIVAQVDFVAAILFLGYVLAKLAIC